MAPQNPGIDETAEWWRRGVVYQVYPRSFADADGDGTGDVEGIRSRLPYLSDLGVDAIWISPWYRSPLLDGGYDVADYRDIDPRFGTLAHAEHLIADAHTHDIRVIVDLVPNHTSSEHEWFQAAVAAGPGSPERNRYIFRDGKGVDGSEPPTNWTAVFGGSAWERVPDGQWYLHLFDPSQPDLDWDNDDVRAEFDDIFRFWLDRGVDGFRIDVAHGLVKDPSFPDLATSGEILGTDHIENHPHWDRDGVHEIIRRWRAILDEHDRDVMMVAEAWVHPSRLNLYLRPDEYHQSFNFDFLTAPWGRAEAISAIDRALDAAQSVGSTPTWTLSNHDVMRHATRLGLPNGTAWRVWPITGPVDLLDTGLGLRRARAAALLLMALPGSVYLYQGEELGLPDAWDLPPEVLDDPVWENSGHQQKGRDGCRVPIPWTTDGPSLGFGAGDGWLPQPDSYGPLSVEAQTGQDGSTLEMYRAALALRNEYFIDDETFEWIDLTGDAFGFRRGTGARCVVNFGDDPVELPDGDVIITSGALVDGRLPGNAAAWLAP
ncbi:MAG: glycoside hydrolase family 13 protein [Ilumatobacteraceae bacterium]